MSLFPAYAPKEETETSFTLESTTFKQAELETSQIAVPETEAWDIPSLSDIRQPKLPEPDKWDIESFSSTTEVERVQETAKKKKKRKKDSKETDKHKVAKKKKKKYEKIKVDESDSNTRKYFSTSLATTELDSSTFYVDPKGDCLLYNAPTLEWPKRPKYEKQSQEGLGTNTMHRKRRPKRYYKMSPPETNLQPPPERAAAMRRALADSPLDEELWERYLDYMERYMDSTEVAEACVRALLTPHNSAVLRRRAHAALWRALTAKEYAKKVQDMLGEERRPEARSELWVRLAVAVGCAASDAAGGGDCALRQLAAAALTDCRNVTLPALYPALLYVYGSTLRSNGRWERLTQLIELVVAMNAPAQAAAIFPPKLNSEAEARVAKAEEELAEYELKAVRSGLPCGEVWARVERARAALHWRAAAPRTHLPHCDPERAPLPHHLADLLVPLPTDLSQETVIRVIITLLRLVEVPLLPTSSYLEGAVNSGRGVASEALERLGGATGSTLIGLFRASRRLAPSNEIRACSTAVKNSLLSKTPLRRLVAPDSDPTGFQAWRTALWEAILRWAEGRVRLALLAWRLREIHARVLLSPSTEYVTWRRIARKTVKDHAPPSPGEGAAVLALLARVEGASGDESRAIRTAGLALSAALECKGEVTPDALFVARVISELDPTAGTSAMISAVTAAGRVTSHTAALPPRGAKEHALAQCEKRCKEIEQRLESEEQENLDTFEEGAEHLIDGMLPGEGEWASARAALATPARVAELLKDLNQSLSSRRKSPLATRYYEQAACALMAAATAHGVRTIANVAVTVFPHNGYLLLASSTVPLWRSVNESSCLARSELGALAASLRALVAAESDSMDSLAAERATRVCGRLTSKGDGGATLSLLQLHCAARARSARTAHVLTAALQLHPHHKELYVSGASLWPAMADTLPDLALDRGLRLYALPDELAPLTDDVTVPTTTPTDRGVGGETDEGRNEDIDSSKKAC